MLSEEKQKLSNFQQTIVENRRRKEDLQRRLEQYDRELANARDSIRITSYNVCYTKLLRTAPGLFFEKDGKYLAMLPGPPRELKPMVENELIPRLIRKNLIEEHKPYSYNFV